MPFGIIGGLLRGGGEKKAARQNRADREEAAALQQPFADTGVQANSAIAQALGLTDGTGAGEGLTRFRESLGFRDQQNRALRGVASNGAAAGLLGSTGTGERFQRTAGELADGTFQSFLSQLAGLQSSGQSAVNNQSSLLANQPTTRGRVLSNVGEGAQRTAENITRFRLG